MTEPGHHVEPLAAGGADTPKNLDPHRVDPVAHRGDDVGILQRRFELPRDRHDADHRGPRRLTPDGERANLGLATTAELLDELRARIDADYSQGGGGLDYTTIHGRPGL